VYGCGCNLEDASMTMLGNEFATLMVVSGIGKELGTRLSDAARKLEWERRLTIFLRPLDEEPARSEAVEAGEWTLTAEGVDKAGIVAGVSRCLAARNILITDLRGRITPMPESGTPLYQLTLRMSVPAAVDIEGLRRDLAAVADRLDVAIEVRKGD
jgi:glycine cleavage system transcriptional repressor